MKAIKKRLSAKLTTFFYKSILSLFHAIMDLVDHG